MRLQTFHVSHARLGLPDRARVAYDLIGVPIPGSLGKKLTHRE